MDVALARYSVYRRRHAGQEVLDMSGRVSHLLKRPLLEELLA